MNSPASTSAKDPRRSLLRVLRDFVPIRPLSTIETLRLAELQADRYRAHLGVTSLALPTEAMTSLPRMHVKHVRPLPVSGATEWSHGRWVILLNAAEPVVRQRFSLAHELKHVIDNRFINVIYQQVPSGQRSAFAEQVCDYFAGCLLVPRSQLVKAWQSGTRDVGTLAALFDVSTPAMATRLGQCGLSDRSARCTHMSVSRALRYLQSTKGPRRYERRASAAPLVPLGDPV